MESKWISPGSADTITYVMYVSINDVYLIYYAIFLAGGTVGKKPWPVSS